MADEELTFNSFSVALMERSHSRMKRAVDSLTDEQMYYQPAQSSNSIAWLVWHLSRFKDIATSRLAGETEVWVSDGWAGHFGLSESANGNGDTPEQVSAFRADRELLLGYAHAAHIAAVRRVQEATEQQLARVTQSPLPGRPPRPGKETLVINASDYTEHTGQIAYIRGMLTGPGWL